MKMLYVLTEDVKTMEPKGLTLPEGICLILLRRECRKTGFTPETVPHPLPELYMDKGSFCTVEIFGGPLDGAVLKFYDYRNWYLEKLSEYECNQNVCSKELK